MLTHKTRILLLFVSATTYTAWFSGVAERGDAANYEYQPAALPMPHPESERAIAAVISRDPFAGGPVNSPSAGDASRANRAPDERSSRAVQSAGGLDVPDIADGDTSAASPSFVARATIVGRNPVAYVQNGTAMDVVRIGDTLGAERVTNIDLRGLTFGDGTRLDLLSFNPPPIPVPAAVTLAHRLDEIRKLLLAGRAAPTRDVRSESVLSQRAAPLPPDPTPAPLASVDMRGIPAGTNPTPDANGPTPLPDPYPYAPPR